MTRCLRLFVLATLVFSVHPVGADDDPEPSPTEEPAGTADGDDGAPDTDPPAAGDVDAQPAGSGDADDHGRATAETAGADPAGAATETEDSDEIPPHLEYDADGDGVVDPEEQALAAEAAAIYKDVPAEVEPAEPGAALKELGDPSMTKEQFVAMVRVARAKVLERLQAKMAKKQDARMSKINTLIGLFSLAGLLLLAMPLVLRKRYPGKGAMLFKYSALAALTFVVTVNFFGAVVLGMRGAQSALGELTNPQLAVASAFFDGLSAEPEKYVPMAKELFGPTLRQLSGGDEGQPIVALIDNAQKLLGDIRVFKAAGNAFKRLDFVFAILPIVLLAVTMLLFVLAIRPTLVAIIKMPGQVAAGDHGAGKAAIKAAGRRVLGEIKATLCTVGVLVVLSLLSAFVLGRMVMPILDLLMQYFAAAVLYLQIEEGASTGIIFLSLFGVILCLAFTLAAIILSTAFFLGKTQKIFQQKFNDGVPLAAHARFWKWGSASVLVAQIVPLLFVLAATPAVVAITESFIGGETISWKPLLVVGPLVLVFGFITVFWAARGLAAIKFLATYKVKSVPRGDDPAPRL